MDYFIVEYKERRFGRAREKSGYYKDFLYYPLTGTYKAIVAPLGALGLATVSLDDITNLNEFSRFLQEKCKIGEFGSN